MIRRSFFLSTLVALSCAGTAAQSQPGPAPGAPPPGPPSSEGTNNPYNSGESEFRDYESNANYTSRALRDQRARSPSATAAASSDIAPGKEVRDKRGKIVGLVETVDPDGAVVSTGPSRVKVPLDAFGKKGDRLMLGITKAEFEALVAAATARPAG